MVTVGSLHAGTSANVIPDEARLDVTVRAISDATLDRLLAGVHRIVAAECQASGCPEPPEVTVSGRTPVNYPDADLRDAVLRVNRQMFGPERVALWPPSLATEDFGLFGPASVALHGATAVRTAYWMLGVIGHTQWSQTPGRDAAQKLAALPPNHSPRFRPDPDPAVPAGIKALVSATLAAGLGKT